MREPRGIKELYLGGNANLKLEIVELVAKLPPTLKTLYLTWTGCFGDAGKADWARLPALERLELGVHELEDQRL